MQHCDTLIAPRWCVPVEPANVVLTDHAVIVSDGRITDLLPLADARQKYQPSAFVEKSDHVLIPGFVNAHTHSAMTLMRGLADDMPLEAWLENGIWPVEKRWVGAEMVRDGTELAIAEMISGGTTCFSDQYFFPEIVAETAVDLHMRAMVGTPIIEFATAWANDASEYMNKANDLVHDPYVDHPLISTCYAPHSTYALSDESFIELRVLADQLDARIQIHLHETAAEISAALERTGKRPFDRLNELGIINASLLAVHCIHMTDDELDVFAASGVNVAHCPRSNLKLASGIAPIAKYREKGLNVAIGTDGAASNNTLDMLSEMRMAALLAKGSTSDATAISAVQALKMATLDGAAALGLAGETGSIEAGKWADLACVDLSPIHSQPVYDPVSQLVYTARADQVTDVWIAGRHQLDNGRLTQVDTSNLLQRSNEWRDRFAASANG
jgi:5-methylthioadenosine/S-adenosylhomocysteine deaminase